jgi:hypothetical protein
VLMSNVGIPLHFKFKDVICTGAKEWFFVVGPHCWFKKYQLNE